ncbi:MAG TPA: glycoside hydrolase family 88 protein [Clostridiaceae bacterium]
MTIEEKVEKVKLALLCMERQVWEQGIASQAFLESGDNSQVILLAKDALVRQTPDGRLGMVISDTPVTDPASNGEPVMAAYKLTGDEKFKTAYERMLDYLLKTAPRTGDGIIYHVKDEDQIWIDGLYMAPPFIAACGLYDEALKQVEGYRKYLWNSKYKLFSHMWDEKKNKFIREAFWGVGNGWAAAGMTRILKFLPANMSKEKVKLAGYIEEVVLGALPYLRADGLFHDVLNDPNSFVETNVGQMLAYTIYKGVKAGYLASSYLEAAHKMKKAAEDKVDEFGLVQGVCGSPFFNNAGTASEGQAFFILMEVAAKEAGF